MPRALPLALLALTAAGCDGGAPDDSALVCADVGLSSRGTLTASTPTGAFRATCFEVRTSADDLTVLAYAYDFAQDEPLRGRVRLLVGGFEPGQYPIPGTPGRRSAAEYDPDPETQLEAETGAVALAEASADRVRGSFSFVTTDGVVVTGGAFDVERARPAATAPPAAE